MSRDILEYEMHSAKLYAKEENVSRTSLVGIMMNARDAVLTVNFHKKVDDEYVKQVLENTDESDFRNLKKVAKAICSGKQIEMHCYLT